MGTFTGHLASRTHACGRRNNGCVMTTPWWYSGGDELGSGEAKELPSEEPTAQESPAADGGRDWMSLFSGAQRMVAWATEQVVAPHAEHDDPREHPQCLLCRGSLLVGDGMGFGSGSVDETEQWRRAASEPAVTSAAPIEWIDFVD